MGRENNISWPDKKVVCIIYNKLVIYFTQLKAKRSVFLFFSCSDHRWRPVWITFFFFFFFFFLISTKFPCFHTTFSLDASRHRYGFEIENGMQSEMLLLLLLPTLSLIACLFLFVGRIDVRLLGVYAHTHTHFTDTPFPAGRIYHHHRTSFRELSWTMARVTLKTRHWMRVSCSSSRRKSTNGAWFIRLDDIYTLSPCDFSRLGLSSLFSFTRGEICLSLSACVYSFFDSMLFIMLKRKEEFGVIDVPYAQLSQWTKGK